MTDKKKTKKIEQNFSDDDWQKERENTKNKTTYSCSPSPMTANFSSNKGLSRSKTPPLPPAFAVGLNMYSSSSFSVALMTTFSRVPRFCCFCVDDDVWKETKLFLLIKPPPKEGMDVLVFEEEEVEEEDEMRPATTTVEDDAASVVNIFCSCCVKRGVLCDVFLRMLLFLFFRWTALLMTSAPKSRLRLCFSQLLRVTLLLFFRRTEKSSSKKNRRESKKSAREPQTSLNCRTFTHSQTKMSQALSSSRVLTNASAVRCR